VQVQMEFFGQGRIDRRGFWIRHLVFVPLALALCIAVRDQLGAPWDLLPVIATLAFLLSVWARRLRDRGRSVWWLALVLIPCLGALILLIECGFRRSAELGQSASTDYKTV
jgi:uncharacterized membrane protein YhaH (DUF805 family)